MPAAARRRCSECGGALPTTSRGHRTTCSNKCRLARKRRLDKEAARWQEDNDAHTGTQVMRAQARDEVRAELPHVIQQELRPVVREAITEEVIRAINELVGLAPLAVAKIHEDIQSDDALIRQKAYTLLMKYTVGHPSLVQPADTAQGSQINVSFELPRPDQHAIQTDADAEVIPEEDKSCDMCQEVKPASQFVANSARCLSCFESWKATILSEHGAPA